mgnify:CR=1 FL=1
MNNLLKNTTRFIFRSNENIGGHILDAANFKANTDILTPNTTLSCTQSSINVQGVGVGEWIASPSNPAIATIANPTNMNTTISGINSPTYGDIHFNEKYDSNNLNKKLPSIGYVSQSASLFGENIYENIAFGSGNNELDIKKIERIVSDLNLDFLLDLENTGSIRNIRSDGTNLSGGERQRISIARVEYSDPDLVVFDEPTSSLDIETENAIMKSIQRIKGSCSIIIISHNQNVTGIADAIYEMQMNHGFSKLEKIPH